MTAAEEGRALRALPSGHQLASVALPAVALLLTWTVYRSVTRTYFFADDFVHMVDIENVGFLRFVLQLFGGHVYMVRNVIIFGAYHLFGFDPRPYYWMALLTHLLNVWLVYRVVRGLTDGNAVVACLGAALWGASPLAAGTVGWFSVYGQELVATILLVFLDQALRTASGVGPSGRRIAAWCLLMLAGMTCFGVGIGIALVFPLVLFLLVPATFGRPRLRLALLAFPLLVAGLYFGFRRIYPLLYAPLPMSEAILGNIAFSQIAPIPSMLWHMIVFGVTGLLSGFPFIPTDYPLATSPLLFRLFALGFGLAFVAGDWTVRRRLVALVLVCVAGYTMIAIGRSNLYRSLKVETYAAARVIRYHYVGLLPLTMIACLIVDQLARRVRLVAPVVLAAWLLFTVQTYRHSTWRIEDRASVRRWVAVTGQKIDAAIDARPVGEVVSIENDVAPTYVLGPALGKTEFPGLAGLFVLTHSGDVVRGRHVRFVERHLGVYVRSRDPAGNRRLAQLLVSPDAVAQAPAAR